MLNLDFNERPAYDICPKGTVDAVFCGIVEQGIQKGYNDKLVDQVKLIFQTEPLEKENGETQRFFLYMPVSKSSSPKSNLVKALQSVAQNDLDSYIIQEGEKAGHLDEESLVGNNCMLEVSHRVSANGFTYAKIETVTACKKTSLRNLKVEGYDKDNYLPKDSLDFPID